MILVTGGWLILENGIRPLLMPEADIRPPLLAMALALIWFVAGPRLKKRPSPIGLILISAALGIAAYAL